jgi:hypothetical protein
MLHKKMVAIIAQVISSLLSGNAAFNKFSGLRGTMNESFLGLLASVLLYRPRRCASGAQTESLFCPVEKKHGHCGAQVIVAHGKQVLLIAVSMQMKSS